ncbi:MAG: UDP-N-acetylmuramoyl-tripeptide--D-alanyl-D-alanine ligase [Pseudonocardiaceae bacterium]
MVDLSQLLATQSAEILQQGPVSFRGVSVHSSEVGNGDLFFALPGRRDGHDFIAGSCAAGATGAVVTRNVDVPEGVTLVKVPDTLLALQELSVTVRRMSHAKFVAVTGSAGKTTTKDMIAHTLSRKHEVLKSRASYNNHIGVPLTLLAIAERHSHVVTELGTNHPGEIAALARMVTPDIGVITNIGFAHVGNFGSQDAIASEKASLLDHVSPGGVCILNGDDPRLFPLVDHLMATGKRVVTVGFDRKNSLQAAEVQYSEFGTSGKVIHNGKTWPLALAVTGRHFFYAALLSVAVGLEVGIEISESIDSLESFDSTPGRCGVARPRPNLLVVDDSHNASPDAMLAGLDLLATLPGHVKIAALGEMKELGESATELHHLVGAKAAAVATHLVTVGPAGAELRASAHAHGLDPAKMWSARSARHALDITLEIASGTGGDCSILVKGSRFTHMERVRLGLGGVPVKCDLETCSLFINCHECPQL